MTTAHSMSGLREIVPSFDDFIVDLWGVVHDGECPFPGVIDALDAIAAAGGRVLFVTNTSRAGHLVVESLVSRMGIARERFVDVVSSGDVTRAALEARDPALFDRLPPSPLCFHFGDAAYVPWLFELGFAMVDELERADLVLATGAAKGPDDLEAVRARLAPAAARGVPLVCTNPDRVIPSAKGLSLGPGAVAQAYTEVGGAAFLYGKPHAPIYEAARRRLGDSAGRRLVAIGDLLATDVRGARDAGIASVLVTGTGGHAADVAQLGHAALFEREGIVPDMLLERFAW
jgi:HAD superfamily hydrolase (TIGR01459 family)